MDQAIDDQGGVRGVTGELFVLGESRYLRSRAAHLQIAVHRGVRAEQRNVETLDATILLHPAGRLEALGRTRSGRIFQSWSNDGGRTWSPLALATLHMAVAPASAHGYVSHPPSRQALCRDVPVPGCGDVKYEPQSVEAFQGSFKCNGDGARFQDPWNAMKAPPRYRLGNWLPE